MTVTGLAVVDTGTDYTLFGQLMILVLIQLGGLGIMSFAVLIFIMLGKKIGLKERLLIQQSLNQTSLGGIIKLIKSLFIYSFAIEMLAMVILAVKWIPEYGFARGVYYSLFHAVSAFNNAGFSIWPDSLMRYESDPLVNLVISFLFIIGGIGFTVLSDLWHKRSLKKLSLHSKLIDVRSFIVNLSAMIFIFLLEYQNQKTLGMLPLAEKLRGAYFQAVTPRTAGFNTTDRSLRKARSRFCSFLCLSEQGSASTGGGIKLTKATFLVILLSVITFLKGKKHISIAKKTLKDQLILRSLAISTISVLLILTAIFILNMTEPKPFLAILFEVVSAFGTVGLSMGITADLSPIGKILIVFIMFLGKLGPLTLAFSLARPEQENIRYSSEDILTG